MTGMIVGFAHVSVAVVQWVNHGQSSDFYFRSWESVVINYLMMMIGGAMAGMPFGLVLVWWENRFARRIRPVLSISLLILVVIGAQWLVTTIEFKNQKLWNSGFGFVILSYLVVGRLLAPSCSHRNVESSERSESERFEGEPQS